MRTESCELDQLVEAIHFYLLETLQALTAVYKTTCIQWREWISSPEQTKEKRSTIEIGLNIHYEKAEYLICKRHWEPTAVLWELG